jgi:CubicO group peptidase (beta-lactamase class C family)
MKKAFVFLITLTLVLTGFPAAAQTTPDFKAIDTLIKQYMADYYIPGAALGIVKDGKLIYAQGYGYSDLDSKKPVTADTVFEIGSISKSFTALDVSQLVDAGKIDLDKPVITYLPDFKLSDLDATKTLTVRQVLSHASGLPRADDLWINTVPASRQQVIDDMAKIKLTAKPGQIWQYCNQNFVLAGVIIEKLTGQTWEDYTQQHILAPLGMKSSGFTIEHLQSSPDHAQPTLPDNLTDYMGIPYTSPHYQSISRLAPAGAINASLNDMAQYTIFQLGDGTFNGQKIVSKQGLDTMHTQQISVKGGQEGDLLTKISLTQNIGYGFGWVTEDYRGYHIVQHDGSIDGYYAGVTMVPSDKLGIILLTNASSANVFLDVVRLSVAELMLGLKPDSTIASTLNKNYAFDPAAVKKVFTAARSYKANPDDLKAVVGDYTGIAGNFSLSLHADGKLYGAFTSPVKVEVRLDPIASDTYALNNTLGQTVTIKADKDGVMSVVQNTIVVGQKADQVKNTLYTDAKGRFSVTVPSGLKQTETDRGLTLVSTDPVATLTVAAVTSSDTLDTTAAAYAQTLAKDVPAKPLSQNDVPVNDQTWTQYIFVLPDSSFLAVEGLKVKDTAYFITVQGTSAALQGMTPAINTMLISFKIGK